MLRAIKRIRVEWSHCDPARIIYNPNYYIWMDQGTHGLLEAAGFPYAEKAGNDGFRGCPLVASGADFVEPLQFNDIVELSSSVTSFGRTSFRIEHLFAIGETPYAKGFEVRVWGQDTDDKPGGLMAVPVPDDIRKALSRDAVIDTTLV